MMDQESLETLRKELAPGDVVFCVLRHRSTSGMTRWISPMVIRDPEYIRDFSYSVGQVLGRSANHGQHDGVKCEGAGMDMGFDLVHSLSMKLFPEGFGCIGERCPSNDHSNGDRDYTPHRETPNVTGQCPMCHHYGSDCTCRRHWHDSGGYALRHRWL
jgi:hypothetical protein